MSSRLTKKAPLVGEGKRLGRRRNQMRQAALQGPAAWARHAAVVVVAGRRGGEVVSCLKSDPAAGVVSSFICLARSFQRLFMCARDKRKGFSVETSTLQIVGGKKSDVF